LQIVCNIASGLPSASLFFGEAEDFSSFRNYIQWRRKCGGSNSFAGRPPKFASLPQKQAFLSPGSGELSSFDHEPPRGRGLCERTCDCESWRTQDQFANSTRDRDYAAEMTVGFNFICRNEKSFRPFFNGLQSLE